MKFRVNKYYIQGINQDIFNGRTHLQNMVRTVIWNNTLSWFEKKLLRIILTITNNYEGIRGTTYRQTAFLNARC